MRESFVIYIAVLGSIAALMTAMAGFLSRLRRARLTGREKFFRALDKKFDLQLIRDRNDILVLINSIARENEREYSLAPLLEDYAKHLVTYASEETDLDKLQLRYETVKKILEEETKEKPFADVPDQERRLFRSIDDAISNDDKQSLKFNIHELSTLVSARNRTYLRTNRLNRWSVPLAIIGLVTTIIFGYLTLANRVDYEQIQRINQELIGGNQNPEK